MADKLELVHKYRPKLLKDVVGQEDGVAILKAMLEGKKLPHAILFVGPSGCGKTTLARVLVSKVRCQEHNFTEINAAEARGIDTIRDIKKEISRKSLTKGNRVYLIDESHKLTNEAQNALLKPLEEPPRDVYFFLATTDPGKLLPTIRSRCTEIKVGLVSHERLRHHVSSVSRLEGKPVSDDVADRIADVADGSPRKALTILNSVIDIKDEAAKLDTIQKTEFKRAAIDLCRAMMPFKGKPAWSEVAAILKDLDEDAEGVRRMVMGYCASVLLKGGPMAAKAAQVMNFFRDPFYDNAGKSVLALCAYEAVHNQ